jgi:hypothetical protein
MMSPTQPNAVTNITKISEDYYAVYFQGRLYGGSRRDALTFLRDRVCVPHEEILEAMSEMLSHDHNFATFGVMTGALLFTATKEIELDVFYPAAGAA